MDKIFQIESYELFQNVSQEILANLYYSGSTSTVPYIEADTVQLAKQELILIISDCNFDLEQIKDVIKSKDWAPEKVKCFQELLEANKSNVLYSAYNHFNSSYCETVLGYDWIVKLVLGTSELKTIKYSLLQLVMTTLNKTGKPNKILYEVNKDMLLKIINSLESLK
ncbi:uncharacterized protein LOC118265426 [Spodoptera frugiperda]|uniref:Uncharacterized protein LOC118265426 n=1 Tax=Spodoptera frugiperda TaxID=7108 RepID=A0A9R0EH87_SPOFR|nr:uncharacterized protein LOC118265426 [Spodoptera frugiperda]